MSQPPDVPGPYGPGPTPPEPDGAGTPAWATPSPGSPDAAAAPPPAPAGYGPPSGYVPPPGYGPGAPGLPPGVRPKRFSGGYVVVGVLAAWAIMVVPTAAALGLVNALNSSAGGVVTLALAGASLVAPLVLGAVLVGRGSPQRRGFGLGLFIGWGLFLVIGAGACIALLSALGSNGG